MMSRRIIVGLLLSCVVICSVLFSFSFADTCPAGTRPATSADLAAMKAAGIEKPVVGQCWDSKSSLVGQAAGDAKKNLQKQLTGAAASRGPASVDNMVPVFACRLDNLFKAAPSNLRIQIFSGWRPASSQKDAANKSAAGYACGQSTGNYEACPHVQGRAADMMFNGVQVRSLSACNQNSACKWAHDNAAKFNLVFPLNGSGSSGVTEPWHIEPKERASVSKGGGCDGTGTVTSTALSSPNSLEQTVQELEKGLYRTFGIAPQYCDDDSTPINGQCPQRTCVNGSVVINGLCYPPSAQQQCQNSYSLYSANQCPMYQQQCPQGFMAYSGQCYPMTTPQPAAQQPFPQAQPQQPAPVSSTGNFLQNPVSTQLNTNTNTNTNTPTIDLINQFANPQATSTISSSTPVSLNSATLDIVQLLAQAPPVATVDYTIDQPTSTIATSTSPLASVQSMQPNVSRSTFTSNDLGNTESPSFSLQQNANTFTLLESLKTSLQQFITYLQQLGSTSTP